MIVVSAALKGGVGKTTTSVYLAALAAATNRRGVALIDADSQASAAEWVEEATDERLQRLDVVEAPTERLLNKALDKLGPDDIGPVDGLAGQPLVPWRRVHDGNVIGTDLVEGLGHQALCGRLDQVEALEPLVLGGLDPFGGTGLRVGVDERDASTIRGRRQSGQVHGRGGLAHAALQRSGDDDHSRSPSRDDRVIRNPSRGRRPA